LTISWIQKTFTAEVAENAEENNPKFKYDEFVKFFFGPIFVIPAKVVPAKAGSGNPVNSISSVLLLSQE
jgi:hypothetical protein